MKAEPADKPGSVVDSHSSRRIVADTLEQPTRRRRGPRHRLPIWPCSRWGLPCRSVAGLAVRSYRTISPLPSRSRGLGRYLSVALSVGSRRPGVTWHRALRSPDFPRRPRRDDATVWPALPGRIVARASRRRMPGRRSGHAAKRRRPPREGPRMPLRTCQRTGRARRGLEHQSGSRRLAVPALLSRDKPVRSEATA